MVETATAPTNVCRSCGSERLYGVANTELSVVSGRVEKVPFSEIEWVHLWCEDCSADLVFEGEVQ